MSQNSVQEVQFCLDSGCASQINLLVEKLSIKQPLLDEDQANIIDNIPEVRMGEMSMHDDKFEEANKLMRKNVMGIFKSDRIGTYFNKLNEEMKTNKKTSMANREEMMSVINSLINLADQMPLLYLEDMVSEILEVISNLRGINTRAAMKFYSTFFSVLYYKNRNYTLMFNAEPEKTLYHENFGETGPILRASLFSLYQIWLNEAGKNKCLHEVPHTVEDIELFIKEWELEGSDAECKIWESLWKQLQSLITQGKAAFVSSYAVDRESAVILTEKVMLKMLATANRVCPKEQQTEIAETCILYALRDKHCYLYDNLLNAKCIQLLKGSARYNLLEIFTTGVLSDYRTYCQSEAGQKFLTQLAEEEQTRTGNLNFDPKPFLEKKIRQLTFIEMANTVINNKKHANGEPNQDSSISFEQLKEELELADDLDCEEFIIDAIRTNMVKAKLSQSARKVVIQHAVPRQFTKKHWEDLLKRLENWKLAISKVHTGFDEIINQVAPMALGGVN